MIICTFFLTDKSADNDSRNLIFLWGSLIIIFLLLCLRYAAEYINEIIKLRKRLISVGLQEFQYNPRQKIVTTIGIKSPTIISFPPHRIIKVIGDDGIYQMLNDSNEAIISTAATVGTGEEMRLTIITDSGKAQELFLLTTLSNGKIIIIRD